MSSEIKNNESIKSCIVLCGGKSSRMGRDKGSMVIQDKPMIKHILTTLNNHINEVIIVLNDKERIDKYSKFINPSEYNYTITFVEDKIKNKGPLPGIFTGLEHISSDYALILPCDSPYVSNKYIQTIFQKLMTIIKLLFLIMIMTISLKHQNHFIQFTTKILFQQLKIYLKTMFCT